MKSVLTTTLLVLLAVVLFAAGNIMSSEKPVRAPIPGEEGFRSPPQDRDFFLTRADERDRERRPERPAHPPRDHHEMHERHRERPHDEPRNFEREMDQQRHRIQNMHVAAEHLDQAGLHDLAHRIHQEANETEQHLRARIERQQRPEHHPPHPGPEVLELLEQLRNEVHELKREVHELRETVARQAEQPKKG
ncbi:hypothetical protein Pan153_45480 [Gimesia panareensis]|uniref:Uncharacterized protein n=1 Tax=Gimesia panareensis TaxID=2527978 RepID=A0A518FU67_9PLAN|nr:hypothetical protein [Gimesia panareensis]QDV19879.1 hypothetical protein Pan153_45480 [Gimesia panareensis]